MTVNPHSMGVPELGKLDPVDARKVWPHEAQSFTPWLLANAETLGQVLEMDLVLSGAEHPIGNFSLDLIGHDGTTDGVVIVENQLDGTDHDHLGRLLTYAAGADAAAIVWIATKFRAEHRLALDWLNTRTDVGTRFFGVEVSIYRIGDSSPAPLFNLVVQPSDWGKAVKAASQSSATTSAKALAYQQFWTRFLDRLASEALQWTNSKQGQPQNWLSLPAGRTDFSYSCSFGKPGLRSEIYFCHPDDEVNTARFVVAQSKQEQLEATYGGALTFEPLAGKKGCRIASYTPGVIEASDSWDQYVEWFVDAQRRLRDAIAAVGGINALIAPGQEREGK